MLICVYIEICRRYIAEILPIRRKTIQSIKHRDMSKTK